MNQFTKQLAATRTHLEALERLAAKAPDLLEHADCGIYLQPHKVHAIICSHEKSPEFWRELALKYREANWKRDGLNWEGTLDGVELTIIDAENLKRSVNDFVFAEEPAHEQSRAA